MRSSIFSALVLGLAAWAQATISSPKAGDQWAVGDDQTIAWDTTGLVGPCDIHLVPAGAVDTTMIIETIVMGTGNTGSYKWTPEKTLTTTNVAIMYAHPLLLCLCIEFELFQFSHRLPTLLRFGYIGPIIQPCSLLTSKQYCGCKASHSEIVRLHYPYYRRCERWFHFYAENNLLTLRQIKGTMLSTKKTTTIKTTARTSSLTTIKTSSHTTVKTTSSMTLKTTALMTWKTTTSMTLKTTALVSSTVKALTTPVIIKVCENFAICHLRAINSFY